MRKFIFAALLVIVAHSFALASDKAVTLTPELKAKLANQPNNIKNFSPCPATAPSDNTPGLVVMVIRPDGTMYQEGSSMSAKEAYHFYCRGMGGSK